MYQHVFELLCRFPTFLALLARIVHMPSPASAAAGLGNRAASFPRRPQPTEKPRLAPPQSTRSIRAVPATGGCRMQDKDQSLLCATAAAVDLKCGGESGGDYLFGAQAAAGSGDESGLVGT